MRREWPAWTIEGQSGDLVTFSMGALEGELDGFLTLLDPEGTILAADDNTGRVRNALIEGFSLPVTGPYTVVASAGVATLLFGECLYTSLMKSCFRQFERCPVLLRTTSGQSVRPNRQSSKVSPDV